MTTLERSAQRSLFPTASSDQQLSPEGSPARTYRRPTASGGKGLKANDLAYGPSSPELLATYDPISRLWKTCQLCFLEREGDGLAVYSETWPRSGMTVNGTAYQLAPLVRLTGEIASGLLPTPLANDAEKRGRIANIPRNGLSAVALYWPTPRASRAMAEEITAAKLAARPDDSRLENLVARATWPTPQASDATKWSDQPKSERQEKGQSVRLPTAVSPQGGRGGRLNPTWVEWLMGFPLGWTDLDV